MNHVDYDGRSPLHLAVAEGHLDCARALLDQKADMRLKDRWGRSALQEARRNQAGRGQILELLLSHKDAATARERWEQDLESQPWSPKNYAKRKT